MHHCKAGEEEGRRVTELFEQFNRRWENAHNRVVVVPLIGPEEATITNVLHQVMTDAYDVLHYCGHCTYNPRDPAASGWLFSDGEVLSADLLSRIDRVPRFVFSNACESGVTPDRIEDRSVDLAPSFAESFFARGRQLRLHRLAGGRQGSPDLRPDGLRRIARIAREQGLGTRRSGPASEVAV